MIRGDYAATIAQGFRKQAGEGKKRAQKQRHTVSFRSNREQVEVKKKKRGHSDKTKNALTVGACCSTSSTL